MHCIPGSTKVKMYTKLANPQVLDWMRETIGMEELSMENCGVTNPAVHSGLGGWCLLNFHETGLKIVGNAKKHIV